jgi:hypothetical protein
MNKIFIFACLAVGGLAATAAAQAPAAEAPVNAYLGSDKCKMCHSKQHGGWTGVKHAKAFDSLSAEEKKKEECVKCHVTGHGKPGGFVSMEKTPNLAHVQCEACHGPGGNHMKAPMADKKKTISGKGVDCRDCHSPHVDAARKKKTP